jgi:hypothetical protein
MPFGPPRGLGWISVDKKTSVLVRTPAVDHVLLRWVCVTSCDDGENGVEGGVLASGFAVRESLG